jgi:DNA-binding response OmpR family regulator
VATVADPFSAGGPATSSLRPEAADLAVPATPMVDATCLIVDPDPAVRHLLARLFARQSYHVEEHPQPRTVVAALRDFRADLVVLAISTELDMAPILAIRDDPELSDTLVLVTIPYSDATAAAEALEHGADDCMAKPISPRELLARMDALLRRTRPRPTQLDFDGLRIDPRARLVTMDGRTVELPRREFDLLLLLARRPGEVVARKHLLRELWANSNRWEPEESLTEHVHRLRRRIEDDPANPRRVETVRGVGYRFNP